MARRSREPHRAIERHPRLVGGRRRSAGSQPLRPRPLHPIGFVHASPSAPVARDLDVRGRTVGPGRCERGPVRARIFGRYHRRRHRCERRRRPGDPSRARSWRRDHAVRARPSLPLPRRFSRDGSTFARTGIDEARAHATVDPPDRARLSFDDDFADRTARYGRMRGFEVAHRITALAQEWNEVTGIHQLRDFSKDLPVSCLAQPR